MLRWLDWFRVGHVEATPIPEEAKRDFAAAQERNYRAGQDWAEAMKLLMAEHRKSRVKR